MAARRAPAFGISDGQTTGQAPAMAMPYTSSGNSNSTTQLDELTQPVTPYGESVSTLRRRIMPIAGSPQMEPGMLDVAQQILARRRGGV